MMDPSSSGHIPPPTQPPAVPACRSEPPTQMVLKQRIPDIIPEEEDLFSCCFDQSTKMDIDLGKASPAVLLRTPSPVKRPGRSGCVILEEALQSPVKSERGSRKPRAEPQPRPEDIQQGFAAQLALQFKGDLSFHAANVSAICDIFKLGPDDVCYCFLCLAEVLSKGGSSQLSLKKWGTGTYAARVWCVMLARFVKSAQRVRWAKEESKVQKLCEEWQYDVPHFMRELNSSEAPFQREYGQTLLKAFQQENVRCNEVLRARTLLTQHGAAAAPQSSRLITGPKALIAGPARMALTNSAGSTGPAPLEDARMDEEGSAQPNAVAVVRKRSRGLELDSGAKETAPLKRTRGKGGC